MESGSTMLTVVLIIEVILVIAAAGVWGLLAYLKYVRRDKRDTRLLLETAVIVTVLAVICQTAYNYLSDVGGG